MPLTPEHLDRLEELLEAAAARPWFVRNDRHEARQLIAYSDEFRPFSELTLGAVWTGGMADEHPNAALIVEAVNALPALVAASRREIELRKFALVVSRLFLAGETMDGEERFDPCLGDQHDALQALIREARTLLTKLEGQGDA